MAKAQDVGFVFQVLNLLPALKVGENIELPMALNGWPHRRRNCFPTAGFTFQVNE